MFVWFDVRLALLVIGVGATLTFGCSSEEIRPPQFGSDAGAVENARSCKEAREGEPSGTVVFVDGQAAACAGNGVECSLADIAAFDGICQVGKPSAVCSSNLWHVECAIVDAAPVEDASAADSSSD